MARWSRRRIVSVLPWGDACAYDDVEAFYTAWMNFDSWREFPLPDDDRFDLADAESRCNTYHLTHTAQPLTLLTACVI